MNILALGILGTWLIALWNYKDGLVGFLSRIFLFYVEVDSNKPYFAVLNNYLQENVSKTHGVKATSLEENKIKYTLASENYYFKISGFWTLVSLQTDRLENSMEIRETLKIKCLKKNKDKLIKLVEELAVNHSYPSNKLKTLTNAYYWKDPVYVNCKSKSNLCLTNEQWKIFKDVEEFFANKSYYEEREIPWKRGYLLYGEPGSGKTSIAGAIAKDQKIPLYSLSLSSIDDDAHLKSLLNSTENKCLVLIEDIDTNNIERLEDSKLTLGGLLNAMDGVGCQDGKVFILTTNHKENLDPALIRAGRCDMHIEFKSPTKDQVDQLSIKITGKKYLGIKSFKSLSEAQEYFIARKEA